MIINKEDSKATIVRLKRARGQVDAVIRMLEDEHDCEKALTQLSAAAKAIDRAGYTLIATGMKQCLRDEGAESISLDKLEKLFLSLS